jgi:magnesium-dependent phosphatase 1
MRALDFFKYREIYPGDKRTHMKNLRKSAEVDFEDMLFFDDERRNSNVESLGVCFWLVKDGISTAEVDAGLKEWRRRSRLRDG